MSENKREIKSAYELAMERMGGGGKSALSDEQKAALSKVDQELSAKLAEIEIMADQRIVDARSQGDAEELQQQEERKRIDVQRARDQAESEKAAIRRR